jgi:flagellar biosynthetic protein FlhB
LTRESLSGTSLALVVDALLLQRPDGWTALLPLHPPSGDRGPEIASAPVRDTLTGSNALFIDMKGEFDQLYSDYLHEAMLLSLAGLAAIVALLGITLRSLKRLAAVMLPLVLAVLMVSAGLSAIGERLHLMHLIGMLLIVAVDVPFQIWQYHDKLKMSRQEVKQEGKELEGNPEIKGRIRQLQREAARKRMMAAVPAADVIVTNPTHYAVALAYKGGMRAPRVLAKGMGEIALRIREIGAANDVPIVEAPPLARALHHHSELDQEIPAPLYAAVAEVLAYVYQLAEWRRTGGQPPLPPRDIAIPDTLAVEVVNG